jgi:uncharacterized protein YjbJ (UPF0337 family)
MTSDRMKGKGKETVGAVKEKVGKTTGNRKLEEQGMNTKAEGKVQKNVGKVKEKVKKAIG